MAQKDQLVVPHSSVEMLWKIVHSQQQQLNRVEHQLSQVKNLVLGPNVSNPFCDAYEVFSDYTQSGASSVSSSHHSFNYKARRREMGLFQQSLEDLDRDVDDACDSSSDEELMSPEVAALIKKYTSN